MKKILVILGTRPEAIKLAPVIKELKKERVFKTFVCLTGQHKEMVEQVLQIFNLKIDYNLKIMKKNQDLFGVTYRSIIKIKKVLDEINPDLLIVQGDTTTAFAASLSSFYKKIKIAHVEAGLRSFNKFHPFPEEINRKFISVLTDLHFAPTDTAAENLINEGVPESRIFITGNTVIDSVTKAEEIIEKKAKVKVIEKSLSHYLPDNLFKRKFILITLHRREKFGEEFEKMLLALKEIADETDYSFVYPVHLNPNVKEPVKKILKGNENFFLLPPLDYLSFTYLMSRCNLIMTDSGGIQEECYIFKKPVIVMREVTERNEAVDAGYAFLTGSEKNLIKQTFYDVDKKIKEGYNFFTTENPFGDGMASKRIVDIIKGGSKNYLF